MFENLRPHLIELRQRVGRSVATVVLFFIVAFIFHEPLLNWVIAPLNDALTTLGKDGIDVADGKIVSNGSGAVVTHIVGGVFYASIKVAFLASLLLSLPVILWQVWHFIAPGLYDNEKKMLLPFVVGGTVMFTTGAAFAYYIVTPFGFTFLISFGSFAFMPLIAIEEYVGFFTKIMFGFGLAFELPIFAYFLALLGLVDDKQMRDFFKYAVIIIFVVAALLTPPDVITQLLMAGPLVLLYAISIFIVKAVNPHKDEEVVTPKK